MILPIVPFGSDILRKECIEIDKSYENECMENLVKITNDKDFIYMFFDIDDYKFKMGHNLSMNAAKMISNKDIKKKKEKLLLKKKSEISEEIVDRIVNQIN